MLHLLEKLLQLLVGFIFVNFLGILYLFHLFLDGMTLHAAFDLNFNGNQHEGLGDKKLAEYRSSLQHLRLIIIDEMSMVDSDKLYKIHRRLCEIFQSDDLFANIGIILVGDLLQVNLLIF